MTRRRHGRPTQRSVEPSHSRQRSRAHGRLLRLFRPPATEQDSISTWNLCGINKHYRGPVYLSGLLEPENTSPAVLLLASIFTAVTRRSCHSITCAFVLFLRLLDALVSFKGKALWAILAMAMLPPSFRGARRASEPILLSILFPDQKTPHVKLPSRSLFSLLCQP